MKSLLIMLMLSASVLLGEASDQLQAKQVMALQLESDIEFQKMVKVYSYEGALIREIPLNDVANNQLTVSDHMILEGSDFAFDLQGDYYYFNDEETASMIN